MFGLFCGFWNYMVEKREAKVLLVGLDKAGKTTFLEQSKKFFNPTYSPTIFSKYTPTVGLNIARLETEENKLLIWDLGGSSSIRSIWKKYFSDAEALIYIVDATMNEQQLQESYESFELAAAGVTKGPILVLLNEKINDNLITMDFLKEKFDPKFEYTANIPEGQKLASEPSLRFPNRINQNNSTYEYKLSHTQRPIKFLTISAIKGTGVKESYEWLLHNINTTTI